MFLVSFGIGTYIAIIAFSLILYFIMKRILGDAANLLI
ncbi:Uncharacterised protein [Klebsiella quasipneumoniae]|nr:Uncharacterised protein [Klebsiella quasipneumoniae]